MFLRFLKDFLLKRKLKNNLTNVKNNFGPEPIRTVGLLVDESYFPDHGPLVAALAAGGIDKKYITVLAYRDKVKKNEQFDYPVFTSKDVNWQGQFTPTVTYFLSQQFDLLVGYYDVEKAPLLLATQQSQAAFKAGFSTIDKRLNHFMIATVAENHDLFTSELFRYLKILNKI